MSDGNLMYNGLAGQHVVNYFTKMGYPCPPFYNHADYVLDLISVDTRSLEAEKQSRERIKKIIEYQKNYVDEDEEYEPKRHCSSMEIVKVECKDKTESYPSSWNVQFLTLYKDH